ncbi:MAG: hypothetical protein MUC94_07125 [bacterium]|nr:hypothetical protein [bacterium]
MREEITKKIWRFVIALICCISFSADIQSQETNLFSANDPFINTNKKILNSESANLAQQILIIDSPGKKGKEFQDTTIIVNTQLTLYAALYNNGKYKSEAKVDWFWADTSNIPANPQDTSIYLGAGSSIIFKPAKAGIGFIFVKDLPSAPGDTTGTIRIIYSEKLIISPAYSSHSTITQGQQNIFASFQVENIGNFPSRIQEANLQFIDTDSQIITNQYTVHRIDTITIIQPGETKQFEFLVDAHSTANTGLVFIDAQLMTGEAFYNNIEPKHRWQVQIPPLLNIDLIDPLVEEVFPGQEDVLVLMYVSNKGGASVKELNASLTFWRNGQEVSEEYEVAMIENNPQFIKGDSSAQISLIVRVMPSATSGAIVINGRISGLDINTNIPYSDDSADLQASWSVTQQTLAQVGIISTRIFCPNADASGNGEININQNYEVEVVVRNQGTQDVQEINVRLSTDGQSRFLTDPSQVIPLLIKDQTDTVTYQLAAFAGSIPAIENFISNIDSASSVGGEKAKINEAFDSMAQVKILYPANLLVTVETGFVESPVRATFDVTATVNHSPENASFDSTGRLSITLPQDYELISEKLVQPFKDNERVTWKIRSTAIPNSTDTILVYISQIPHDKNNPDQLAQVSVGSAFLTVKTLDTFIEIADVAIIEPEGAVDDTISAGQLFLVRARMKSQLVENISAQIIPPVNFSVEDYAQKPLQADSVTWRLRSPNSNFSQKEPILHYLSSLFPAPI